jgi:hypothetical protein
MVEVRPGVLSCPLDLPLDTDERTRVALLLEEQMKEERD